MFFPIRTDVPLLRSPWMNWAIMLLNFVFFALRVKFGTPFVRMFELNPAHPILYTYLTYAFIHADVMHIGSNLLFLYIFGNNVNDRLGHFGYLGFYLAGAVISGVAHVLLERSPVIGASGAVFAVTGAFLVLFPRSRVTIIYFFILIGVFEIASMWFILAFFALNVLNVFSQAFGGSGAVAYGAHVGGCLFGVIVCLSLLATGLLPRNQWDLLALIDRWNRRRQYRGVVRAGYDPFDYLPANSRNTPNPRGHRLAELRAAVAEAMAHGRQDDAVKLFMELRAIDPSQVLSRQNQLDIGNQLFEAQHYSPAADAYEGFVRAYPKGDQINHVMLMLGLIYARYLNRPDLAEPYLRKVIERLHEGRDAELARGELAKISSPDRQ